MYRSHILPPAPPLLLGPGLKLPEITGMLQSEKIRSSRLFVCFSSQESSDRKE